MSAEAATNSVTMNFDYYPRLEDLLRNAGGTKKSGVPGFEYAIFSAAEMHLAQEDGWSAIANMMTFTIKNQPVVLTARGNRIPGMDIGDWKCSLRYSATLEELTGMPLAPLERSGDEQMVVSD